MVDWISAKEALHGWHRLKNAKTSGPKGWREEDV